MKMPARPFDRNCHRVAAISVAVLLLLALGLVAEEPPGAASALPLPFTPGSATLAVLPATQYYAQKYPQHFEAQTRWIADQHQNRHIVYALHLGDIVQDDLPAEWEVAQRCLGMLDGKVPYLLTPGNHDYSDGGRDSRLSEYFPVAAAREWPAFGGVFQDGRLDNNYHLFEIGTQQWIALGLEYGPRQEVMDWANRILLEHRGRHWLHEVHRWRVADTARRQGSAVLQPCGHHAARRRSR